MNFELRQVDSVKLITAVGAGLDTRQQQNGGDSTDPNRVEQNVKAQQDAPAGYTKRDGIL